MTPFTRHDRSNDLKSLKNKDKWDINVLIYDPYGQGTYKRTEKSIRVKSSYQNNKNNFIMYENCQFSYRF